MSTSRPTVEIWLVPGYPKIRNVRKMLRQKLLNFFLYFKQQVKHQNSEERINTKTKSTFLKCFNLTLFFCDKSYGKEISNVKQLVNRSRGLSL